MSVLHHARLRHETARLATIKEFFEELDKLRPAESPSILASMSADQVRRAWGEPTRINRTVNASHVREQWVYGRTYVYIVDDVMTSFQD